ncbi:MAG: M28 family peptidase [Acidobacteria bacterium]|nr:M28 family peptidase [Acidobacteriota bacterium]
MYCRKALIIGLLMAAAASCSEPPTVAGSFLNAGEGALAWTAKLVELGPRPPGSEAHRKQQALVVAALRATGADVEELAFTAQTPLGPVAMKNVIAKFYGASDRIVVISGHYDTLSRSGLHFVGANDGGSSAGLLLQLAEILAERKLQDDVWLAFFDGEESFVQWTGSDHTYGSRHQAAQWSVDGTAARINALINVDMIGDADLRLVYEQQSTPWLRDLVWDVGVRLGYTEVFADRSPAYIADDHVSFLQLGIPAVDLIDFEYGGGNSYWHNEHDTMDKLSAASFGVMLHVVLETIEQLAARP